MRGAGVPQTMMRGAWQQPHSERSFVWGLYLRGAADVLAFICGVWALAEPSGEGKQKGRAQLKSLRHALAVSP